MYRNYVSSKITVPVLVLDAAAAAWLRMESDDMHESMGPIRQFRMLHVQSQLYESQLLSPEKVAVGNVQVKYFGDFKKSFLRVMYRYLLFE